MEEIKIIELPEKPSMNTTDYVIVEDEDGTKKVRLRHFRSLIIDTLYFNSVEELKNSSEISLKEGDICETLGYYEPGDGGGAKYRITYNPGIVEDGKLVHYLSYSDTLRAEIILGDKINVHQFGAKGDGTTDDYSAIQAAIDNSDNRVIEFSNGKTYITRNIVTINKSNIIINGNGAILYPYSVTAISIQPSNTIANISDITINNLNFESSRASKLINIDKSENITIMNCDIRNISSYGINIANSAVNIDNCILQGFYRTNISTLINISGSISHSQINITDCKFDTFLKAVCNESTSTIAINVYNCSFYSIIENCYCIYLTNTEKMVSLKSNYIENADTFLCYASSSNGNISCADVSCYNVNKLFDIGGTILHLNGAINILNSSGKNTIIFERMMGRLHSNIDWNSMPSGASFNSSDIRLYGGELFDTIYPYQYNKTGYSISNSKLTLEEFRNIFVDWDSANDLNEIENGIEGQLLYIISSQKSNIINVSNKIILSDSSIKLGTHKGVLLKYTNSQWVQVQ